MEDIAGIRISTVKIKIGSGIMKKFKGFSLAEMMIVLLIISITLAATAPMITRKITKSRSQENNNNNEQVFSPLKSDPKYVVEYIKGLKQRIIMGPVRFGITPSDKKIPRYSVVIGSTKFAGDDKPLDEFEEYYRILGRSGAASGKHLIGNIAIGTDIETFPGSINIGNNNRVHGFDSIAIGNGAETFEEDTIAIGIGSHVGNKDNLFSIGGGSMAIGNLAGAEGTSDTALGYHATATGFGGTALGSMAEASGGLSIGPYAKAGIENKDTSCYQEKDPRYTDYYKRNVAIGNSAQA